jgi:hypothetical protein
VTATRKENSMKKFCLKGTSEDVHDDRLSDEQLLYMIQNFKCFILNFGDEKTATYDFSKYPLSRKYCVTDFTLTIEKTKFYGEDYYEGIYRDGSKRFIIHATLEDV